jgi:hypothetical protein
MADPRATNHEPVPDAHPAAAHDTHDDEHRVEESLGPIDWPAWRAAIVGVAVAALVVFLFALAAWR